MCGLMLVRPCKLYAEQVMSYKEEMSQSRLIKPYFLRSRDKWAKPVLAFQTRTLFAFLMDEYYIQYCLWIDVS